MVRMYGSRISYYAGKVQAYLRYRGIEYEMLSMVTHANAILEGAGAVQSPVLQLEDGRWLSDSTPILAWYDAECDGPSIYPADPVMRFFALLLEDHADEWLWRPAMHYRWSYPVDREHASATLTDELLTEWRIPRPLKRWNIARRQFRGFVRNDGVSDATRAHVEATAMTSFDLLEAILAERPFLLGERPSVVDFGFVGPMFHHFAQDPTPAELMRQRAPHLYAWVARMWEAAPTNEAGELQKQIDAPLAAQLREACETHLVQQRGNAKAYATGQRHFAMEVQGCRYERLPVSRYRVWCLEELRARFAELAEPDQAAVRAQLTEPAASVLWEQEPLADSGYDPERRAPFNRAINVFGTGAPE